MPTVRSYEDSRRAFRWHIPDAFNAATDSLDRQCRAGADPDRTALVAAMADGTVAHVTYSSLKRLSDLLAAAFANLVVEPGSRVATHPHWFSDDNEAAIGRAIPGASIDIVDADGQRLLLNAIGHLAVAQDLPSLCLGCNGPPPAVARLARRKYVGRWFLTDDIVSLDDDGNLRFTAKADDILPCEEAGFLPDDVERVLAITGKDGKTQEVAAAVAKDGLPRGDAVAEVLLAADILAEAAKSLTPYALPKRIVFVDGIPPTPTKAASTAPRFGRCCGDDPAG